MYPFGNMSIVRCNSVVFLDHSATIVVVRVLFFTPGVLVTIIGIILIVVATVNVPKLRIITFTTGIHVLRIQNADCFTGCLFVGCGICGMIFIIIGYKHLVRYLRRLRCELDTWLGEQTADFV